MIKITESEQQKLKSLAYDDVAMEALKKFFLGYFIKENYMPSDTALLASEKLSITLLEKCFESLEKMKSIEHEEIQKRNIV